ELDRYVELELAGEDPDARLPGLRAPPGRLPGLPGGAPEPARPGGGRGRLTAAPARPGVGERRWWNDQDSGYPHTVLGKILSTTRRPPHEERHHAHRHPRRVQRDARPGQGARLRVPGD